MSVDPAPELVAERLREALADLRRPINSATGNGWKKGTFGIQASCKCLDGALFFAVRGRGPVSYDVLDAMRRRVVGVIADIEGVEPPTLGSTFIWAWNDDEARVFAEVEAVLERAISEAVSEIAQLPPVAQRAMEAGW